MTMATTWADGPLLGFDLETTGTDTAEARIVTATTVLDVPGQDPQVREWLVNPGIDIPSEAAAVHGVTTEHARAYGMAPRDALRELGTVLVDALRAGIPVVAFNAAYDCTVTDRELRRHLNTSFDLCGHIIDPMVIDRAVDKYRKGKRKLGMVCAVYGVMLTEADAHTSTGDTIAAVALTRAVGARYPVVGRMGLPDLHVWQAAAHRSWADGRERWLRDVKRREGATAEEVAAVVIERGWPLRVAA